MRPNILKQMIKFAASSKRVNLDFRKYVTVAILCNHIFLILLKNLHKNRQFFFIKSVNLTLWLIVSSPGYSFANSLDLTTFCQA